MEGCDADLVTLALCGDVMLGRGIDQILPHPGAPELREACVRDARDYVALAEAATGPVPWPVPFSWPWGDALRVLDELAPVVRVVNLETSVTGGGDFAPGKPVHYRMNPANLPCLAAARPDVCVLANNHVLDFGRRGLAETLDSLSRAGLRSAGAGQDLREAERPAVVTMAGGGRALVFAVGTESSGVPPEWAATPERSGVAFIGDLSAAADALIERIRWSRCPGDLVVVSVHWGSNWGYHVPREQVRFAHRLIDGGAGIVHGHSSHHPRPIEVYHGRLVLYGCGDFIDDYEGISGHERYRDDLRLLYLVSLRRASGELAGLRMVPLRARRMRLGPAPSEDRAWLRGVLDSAGRDLGAGARVDLAPGGALVLRWGAPRPDPDVARPADEEAEAR